MPLMNDTQPHPVLWRRWLAGIAAVLAILVLVLVFFPWDVLRGPINRHVSDQLGRRFEITRHLSVHLGRTVTVRADGVEFANPEWASKPYLVKAQAAEFDIKLLPLLLGKVVLPRIALTAPEIGLQMEPDGRRTWALSRDTSDEGSVPRIDALLIDGGSVDYQAAAQGANIHVDFSLAQEAAGQLPLSYKAKGKWQNEAFSASGRTGGVLQLSKDIEAPFPIEVNAVAGKTSLKAKGTIANLAELAGVDASFDLQGRNLEELYKLLGVVLPSTPPYKLRGKLAKHGKVWAASQIQGTLGSSDLSGALSFDQSAAVPLLTGKVQSKLLDFADLAPVIGLPPPAGPTPVKAAAAKAGDEPVPAKRNTAGVASRKVLPVATLDVTRLKAMNADVVYSASDIRHVEVLPLDKGSVHVKLNAGVLQLEPISLGIAGGTVAGSIRIDANVVPASFATRLDLRAVQLNQLFPAVETSKSSLGKISGQFDLKGRGNSLAQMLGTSSGDVAVLMGKGQISNILLEFMGLDGGEIIKFLVRGDRNVQLRCAAAAFEVKQGLMSTKTIVLDTTDTVINGRGTISLADETLDLILDPAPKDRSILSFRSPLRIGGTFAAPSAGPDKSALAGRAGIALALGVINPLLALAATIETGPGQDENCVAILKQAAASSAGSRMPVPAVK
ncbi:AsmA family protein [Polaromonas sp. LjRoot131]|uniref:AsmA family protein n=1 Tax=Polaromonas sp. LjRoot131 TaxID=3342262 RepID=UPI003ECE215F